MIKWFHKVKEIHQKREQNKQKKWKWSNSQRDKASEGLLSLWLWKTLWLHWFLSFSSVINPSCFLFLSESIPLKSCLLSPLFPLFLLSNIPHVCKHDRMCLFVNVYVTNTNKYIKIFLYSPINNGNAQNTDNIVSQKCLMFSAYSKASHDTVIWYFERKWPQRLWCEKHEATCHIVPHTADRDQCWCLTGLFSHLFYLVLYQNL